MSLRIEPYTTQTITEPQALFDRMKADREQGFSIVDEELERGLRSIAVPIVDRRGDAVAGLKSFHQLHAHHPQPHARPFPAEASSGVGAHLELHRLTAALRIGRSLS